MEPKRTIFWLWISIIIFAASNSVVAKIGQLGTMYPVNGHNPISFCNLFFAGNLVAGITLFVIYRKNWHLAFIKAISFKVWCSMLLIILISGVIAPAFFFIALMMTEVTNVVLISTLEVPLGLIFAFLMFREQSSGFGAVGAVVSTLGIIAIFAFDQPPMEHREIMIKMLDVGNPIVNRFLTSLPKGGEILTGIATLLGVVSVQMSRKLLEVVPVGIFSVARMIVGVLLFAIIAFIVFGPQHFDDLVSPFLWAWMLIYGALIVVLGQITWFKGIKGGASSTDISVATALTPIAGTFFAFLILGEVPNKAQLIGGIIIIVGVVISLFGTIRAQRRKAKYEKPSSFSGV